MKIEKEKNIKYINGDKSLGIDYDYQKITRTLHKVIAEVCKANGIDTDTIYIDSCPSDTIWNVLCSERNVGKTTYEILEGIVKFLMYNTRTEYIREKYEYVAPSVSSAIFDTILSCGYIENMTGGDYNGVKYKDKFWYLVHRKENGEIDKENTIPFMRMHHLEDKGVEGTKSTYNSPYGDHIIYDEFIPISGITRENTWINFIQLISTIRRSRLSFRVYMLANTINSLTHYFHELGIFDDVQKMKRGEKKIVYNDGGTNVYIYIIAFGEKVTEKRKINNNLAFGFRYKNPRLAAITGQGAWEIKNYPHLPLHSNDDTYDVISPIIYYKQYGRFIRLELRDSETLGVYGYIWESKDEPLYRGDEIIYTLSQPQRPNEVYANGLGRPIDKLILELYKQNRFYYAYNDIGHLYESYMKESAKIR